MPFPAHHTFHADDAGRYHLSASLPATSCSCLLKADAPHAPEHILWSAASSCSQGPGIPNTRILRSLHIPSEYTKSDPASNAVRLFLYHERLPSPCGKIPAHRRHLSKMAVLMIFKTLTIFKDMFPLGSAPRLPAHVSSHCGRYWSSPHSDTRIGNI